MWDALGLHGEHDAARTRCSLAMALYWQGRHGEARRLLEDTLAIFEAKGHVWWTAFALSHLGRSALALKEYARARELILEGLAMFRSIGNRWGLGLFLVPAAQLYLETGMLQEARAHAEEACALLSEIGHKHVLGDAYRLRPVARKDV